VWAAVETGGRAWTAGHLSTQRGKFKGA